jgi:hypothetical protein
MCALCLPCLSSLAAEPETMPVPVADVWSLGISPWTHHYRHSDEHKQVWALGLERETPEHALYGLTLFSNSYGQPSAYAYYGHVFNNVTSWSESLYVKVTGGVIYGYKEPYADKMPLNYHGFSPVIVPAIGWHLNRAWSVQAHLLGTSALMVSLNHRL